MNMVYTDMVLDVYTPSQVNLKNKSRHLSLVSLKAFEPLWGKKQPAQQEAVPRPKSVRSTKVDEDIDERCFILGYN